MLILHWVSPTILEVNSVVMGCSSDDHTYWYYDTEKWLVSQRGLQDEAPTVAMRDDQIYWVKDHYLPLVEKQIAERLAKRLAREEELAERAHRFANPAATMLWIDEDQDKWAKHPFKKMPKTEPVSISTSGLDRSFKYYHIADNGSVTANALVNEDTARVEGEFCGILRLGIKGRDYAIAKGYISAESPLANDLLIAPVPRAEKASVGA
jgi:hypothetical protein